MADTADPALGNLRTTMSWAAGAGWLGALVIGAYSWLMWAAASAAAALFGFLEIAGAHVPAATRWPALGTAICAGTGLAVSLAVAWLIGRSPGLLPSWLAGLVAAVLGTTVGLVALEAAVA